MKFTLSQFDGPLDLLLQLIDQKELTVSEVAIGEVTEQFLDYLEQMDETKAEELADFLVIATRLLVMKSRALLPQFAPEEEDGPGLAEQLKLYKAFVDASNVLHEEWISDRVARFRKEPTRVTEEFVPPENVSTDAMHAAMVQLIRRLAPPKPLPKVTLHSTVSVKQRISQIRQSLKKSRSILFSDLLADQAKNKSEVIVGFLALLELVKQQHARLEQDELFGDITVNAV